MILTSVVVLVSFAGQAYATSILMSGETEEVIMASLAILKSGDEAEVYSYLSHAAASVRLTAVRKLGNIGTSSSLNTLEAIAEHTANKHYIRNAACTSYWNIVYREDLIGGDDGSGILLSVFSEPLRITVIDEVRVWALNLLGDGGVEEAIPIIERIMQDPASSKYIKEKAVEAQKKIVFIGAADLKNDIERLIEEGLEQDELCVRKWAIDRMRDQGYADIITRLELLYDKAVEAEDSTLGSYIAIALDEEVGMVQYPALEIAHPQSGITVKTPIIMIDGSSYGKSFMERWKLNPGVNTYTKTITDRDGNQVSKSVTVYFENQPPVLNHIEDVTIQAGEHLTIKASGSDPDDNNLEFAAYGLPEGATFDHMTQTFSWQNTKAGVYKVTFVIDDGWWLFDRQEIKITVTGSSDNTTSTTSGTNDTQTTTQGNSNNDNPDQGNDYGDDSSYEDSSYEDTLDPGGDYGDGTYDDNPIQEGYYEEGSSETEEPEEYLGY